MVIDGYCTLGVDREYDLTPDALLSAMDTANVDLAVIAPTPRQMAVHNREGNDFVLGAAAGHPDRFIPACSANPWRGREAVAEAIEAFKSGARLLVLDPEVQGFGIGTDLADPLIEAAADADIPVYVHTGGYQHGAPAQLGLMARRFAEAVFILGHCGSTDFKADALEVARLCPNVFVETSLAPRSRPRTTVSPNSSGAPPTDSPVLVRSILSMVTRRFGKPSAVSTLSE